MNGMSISKTQWQQATAESNRLFAEADHLNEIACALLTDKPTTAEAVERFQQAKNAANAKYEEAHRAWQKAKAYLRLHANQNTEPALNDIQMDVLTEKVITNE